jgi:photosystem II PsbU protein
MIGSSLFFGGVARAEINYDGVKYLGGGDKVDVNNANIRVYLKYPGLYPTIAGKVVKYGPYKAVADIYNVPGLSSTEKDLLKKYEDKFVVLDPKPEYILDKFNNGLYR